MKTNSLKMTVFSLGSAWLLAGLAARGADCASLTLNASDQGWYDGDGYHEPSNNNYYCGDDVGGTFAPLRNWFVFQIPTLTQSVASATLRINTYDIVIPGESETYELRQVSTPPSNLAMGGFGLTNIYHDLGDGPIYGSRTLLRSSESQQFVTISLNAAFRSALTAASGGSLALGGQLVSLDGIPLNNEFLFGSSSMGTPTNPSVQLLVTYSNASPLIIVQEPASLSVPPGDGASFQVQVCGGGAPSYQWQRSGTNLPGATQPFLQLLNVSPSSAGSYRVLVTDASRTVTSAVATLTVSGGDVPSGYIYISFGQSPMLAGSAFGLCSAVSSGTATALQWQLNGNNLPGETNSCLYAWNAQTNQSGSYRLVASNSAGALTSAPISMVITQAAPSGGIYLVGGTQTPPAGSSVTFCSSITGGPIPSLQWQHNGLNLPGQTNACLGLSNLQSNRSGLYRIVATNAAGAFTSAPITLTVTYSPPSAYLYFSSGQSPAPAGSYVVLCSGVSGAPAPDLQWQFNGANLPLQTNLCLVFPSVSSNHAGSYRLVATNSVGAFTSAPIALAVSYYAPTGSVFFSNGQSPAPAGSSVMLCSTISGAPAPTLQWQFNGTNLAGQNNPCLGLSSLSSKETGLYSLVASNTLGAITSAPIALVVNYTAPYGSIYPSGVLSPVLAGSQYSLCSTIYGAPTPTYQWQFNGTNLPGQLASCLTLANAQTNQSGSYRLIASNSAGVFTSAVAVVSVVYAPPTVDIFLSYGHTPTVVGSGLTLCSSVSGSPYPTVQWQFNGTNLLNQTNGCLYFGNLQTNQSGAYTLVASNTLGATTSRVAMISVVEPAPVLAYFSYLPPTAVGSYQYLCAETSIPGVTALQWRFNGTNLMDATNICFYLSTVQPGDAGDYSVVATTTHSGSYTSAPITLTIFYEPPKQAHPQFLLGSGSALVGEDVSLSASYSGSPCFVQWRFNGADLPGQTNGSLALLAISTNQAGQYSFTATNLAGMTTSTVVTINVRYQPPIFSGHPASQSVVEGTTARFRAYAPAGPPPVYFLEMDGTNVAVPFTYEGCCGANSGGFSLFDTTFADAGHYRIIASNSLGVATSTVATLTVTRAGPLDRWTQRNPLPQSQPLLAVAHGTNQFVAVGDRGTILTSPDGSNWSLQNRRADVPLNGVAYGGGLFVAVGEGGTILSSSDGTNWAYRYTAAATVLNAVAHADGRFVVVGSAPGLSTLIMHSTNGIRWERIALGGFSAQQCVAYGDGKFVAAGSSAILVSATGTNWGLVRSVSKQVENVTYADNLFVAVGDDGSTLVSTDGMSWTSRPAVTSRRLLGVSYGAGRFVAAGARGTMLTSTDSITWTPVASGTPDRLETIDFSGGIFIAAGENGTIITSTNGTSWSTQSLGITRDLDGMAVANGLLVAVGKGGSILTSTDGARYTAQNAGVTNDLHGVTWGGGLWVAVGEPGIILTSSNAVDWTSHASGNTNSLKDATYADGQWIVVGTQGTIVLSTNGADWTTTFTFPPYDLNDAAYGNGQFLVAGDGLYNRNGSAFSSVNGLVWTRVDFYPGRNLRGVIFVNGLFLFTANDGVVYTTSNALSFYSSLPLGGTYDGKNLRAATWAHELWIVVGNDGIITTSPDLFTWTRRASRTFENQHQVALLDGKLVVIGNRGTILQSGRFVTELEAPVMVAGTGVRLPFKGVLNQAYAVQSSTNLVNWTTLSTIWSAAEYSEFTDTNAWQHPRQFYRLVEP